VQTIEYANKEKTGALAPVYKFLFDKINADNPVTKASHKLLPQ
jgi:hypothetical protein